MAQLNQTQTVNAALVNHCGAEVITRNELANLQTAKGTDTHVTIPHHQLVDTLDKVLQLRGLQIVQEQYSVMSQANKLFGVLKVKGMSMNDYQMAIGLRTSNDKKFPVQLIAGANIFVCDNLAFSGNIVALKRRHTVHIDIRAELMEGVNRAIASYRMFTDYVAHWKQIQMSNVAAKALILDAGVQGVMPLHLIPNVLREWETPKHKEFDPRTLWSLHNSFTEAFKHLKPHIALESANQLGKMIVVAGITE